MPSDASIPDDILSPFMAQPSEQALPTLAEIASKIDVPSQTRDAIERCDAQTREQLDAELISMRQGIIKIEPKIDRLIALCAEQASEINRLKAGQFTPEEFQNLCHAPTSDPKNFNHLGMNTFCDGCDDYQRKLFGTCRTDLIRAGQLLAAGIS